MGHEEREVLGGGNPPYDINCGPSESRVFTEHRLPSICSLVFHGIAIEFATSFNSCSERFGTNPVRASVWHYDVPPFSKARSVPTK